MKAVELQAPAEAGQTDVHLDIIIGNGQMGVSAVKLGARMLADGDAEIRDLLVGKASTVRNRILQIKSVVTDVNDQTNRTSVRYVIKTSGTAQTFTTTGVVDQDGDAIIHRANFYF